MSKKILLVDDDPTLIKLVQSYLESQGFTVFTSSDGEAGIEQLKKQKVDLIILDVQMPKMNGYTFIFEMKRIEHTKSVPVIVLTAKEGMAEVFKIEGVKEYLNKPFQPETLLKSVNKYI